MKLLLKHGKLTFYFFFLLTLQITLKTFFLNELFHQEYRAAAAAAVKKKKQQPLNIYYVMNVQENSSPCEKLDAAYQLLAYQTSCFVK